MNDQNAVQELKAERVQEEVLALMSRRVTGKGDAVGAAMGVTCNQAKVRLKAERVQTRLKRLQGWTMKAEGHIDRVREFEDPQVAAAYLAFASQLARQAGQPLRVLTVGGVTVIALTGRTKGTDKGITHEVLDLAEQLG